MTTIKETTYEIGSRVQHVESGLFGTVTGRPVTQRSAGGALMQRVRWDGHFTREEGSPCFVRRLKEATDGQA